MPDPTDFKDRNESEPDVVDMTGGGAQDESLAEEHSLDADRQPLASPEDAFREKWLRAAAEAENLRKRLRRDVDTARRRERADALRPFLAVVDNFDRALAAGSPVDEQWLSGITGIRTQLLDVLKGLGAEPFDAVGETFDPHRHEAVAMVPHPDFPPNTVCEVVQPGYSFEGDGVLRHAQVLVTPNE